MANTGISLESMVAPLWLAHPESWPLKASDGSRPGLDLHCLLVPEYACGWQSRQSDLANRYAEGQALNLSPARA
jgi:hypothetical protein